MKLDVQARTLQLTIFALLLLGVLFLSVGYGVAKYQGMTSCSMDAPGFILLRETYGFDFVKVQICFPAGSRPMNASAKALCDPGIIHPWCVSPKFSIISPSCLF